MLIVEIVNKIPGKIQEFGRDQFFWPGMPILAGVPVEYCCLPLIRPYLPYLAIFNYSLIMYMVYTSYFSITIIEIYAELVKD